MPLLNFARPLYGEELDEEYRKNGSFGSQEDLFGLFFHFMRTSYFLWLREVLSARANFRSASTSNPG